MSERTNKLRDAVQVMHKCTAIHVESVAIFERFAGKPVWEGVVDVFDIFGNAAANRCYAWSFVQKGEPQFVVVLHRDQATSPHTAVRDYVMAGFNNPIT